MCDHLSVGDGFDTCSFGRFGCSRLIKHQRSQLSSFFFVDFECFWHHLVALTLYVLNVLPPAPTCLIDRLLVELAVCNLLFHAALLVLWPRAGGLVGGGGSQRSHHLLATQSLPLTLLRHLQPELVVHPKVARTHISVSDDSVWMDKDSFTYRSSERTQNLNRCKKLFQVVESRDLHCH